MSCLLEMSVMFVTLNSSMKIGVTVVCVCVCVCVCHCSLCCVSVMVETAPWPLLTSLIQAHWPSIDSFHSVTYTTNTFTAARLLAVFFFWEWEHRNILWCIYFEEQIKYHVPVIQCQFIIDTLYLIVSSGNSQNISGDRPADVPNNIIELMEQFGRPGVSCRIVTRPDKHTSVLNKVQRKQLTKKCIRLNALYSDSSAEQCWECFMFLWLPVSSCLLCVGATVRRDWRQQIQQGQWPSHVSS